MQGDDGGASARAGGVPPTWRCPWCREALEPDDAVTCPHDDTPMHRDCARAHEVCPVCGLRQDTPPPAKSYRPHLVAGHGLQLVVLGLAAVGCFVRGWPLPGLVCLALAWGVARLLALQFEEEDPRVARTFARVEAFTRERQVIEHMRRVADLPVPTARPRAGARPQELAAPEPAAPEPALAPDEEEEEDEDEEEGQDEDEGEDEDEEGEDEEGEGEGASRDDDAPDAEPAVIPLDLDGEVGALLAAGLLEPALLPVRIGEGAPFQPGREVSVRQAILEVPGIGTATVARLRAAGIDTVADLLARGARVPGVPANRAEALERWAAKRAREG